MIYADDLRPGMLVVDNRGNVVIVIDIRVSNRGLVPKYRVLFSNLEIVECFIVPIDYDLV